MELSLAVRRQVLVGWSVGATGAGGSPRRSTATVTRAASASSPTFYASPVGGVEQPRACNSQLKISAV